MAVLYRKYRPQTFSEVLNQKYIIQTLKNQVSTGSISHAYLFMGSRGVGKTSVARIFAKAVNCLHQTPTAPSVNAATPPLKGGETADGDACGVCENCKQIAAGSFFDLVEIDAASNTGVDNIRELIEHVKFSPSQGKYKVFIIDEVHMLSKGAFNALLKTLEEPPKHAIFILATTEINKVPATIISRTQRFDFKALSAEDLQNHLEKICKEENFQFTKEILALIAQNAEGSVRDALSLLDKLMTLGSSPSLQDAQQLLGITDIAVCENLLEIISTGQVEKLPDFIDILMEKGLDFSILNRDFLEYLRKTLVYKLTEGKQFFALAEGHKNRLRELSDKFSVQDLMFFIRLFLRSYKELDSSPSVEIPLLLGSIEAALRKKTPAVAGKMSQPQKQLQHFSTILPKAEEVRSPVVESVVSESTGVYDSQAEEIISLAEVEEIWPRVIEKVKEVNSPLASLLRKSVLMNTDGNKIILGVKFLFDKQNLENFKNASVVSEGIEQIFGRKMQVCGRVIKEEVADAADAATVLNEALKVFGGELVE